VFAIVTPSPAKIWSKALVNLASRSTLRRDGLRRRARKVRRTVASLIW
jgi:hypothetical protein